MSEQQRPDIADTAPVGSFEETREFRLELTLRATPAQRLAWLEDAIRLAHASGALPRKRE